jgi:hypothetical protein
MNDRQRPTGLDTGYPGITPDSLGSVARRNIVDGRNAREPAPWRDAGCRALGKARESSPPQGVLS